MRKLVALAAVVAALAIGGPLQANAEVEICLVDPPVHVDSTVLHVGLYTADTALPGDIDGRIMVWLRPGPGQAVKTDVAAWNGKYATTVQIGPSAPAGTPGSAPSFEVDAFVPTGQAGEAYTIRVTLPDGSALTANGVGNALVRLPVPLPMHGGARHRPGDGGTP